MSVERIPETRIYLVKPTPDRIRCEHTGFDLIHSSRWDEAKTPVVTKKDFYRRFYKGEFGNHGPMWSSFQAWARSGYDHPIAIRTEQVGGRCDYDIAKQDVQRRTNEFIAEGWLDLNWSAMMPHDKQTIQGEVRQGFNGLDCYLSHDKSPMRHSLASGGFHVDGICAVVTLRHYLDGASYEWLQYLLDTYRDHVIEFSSLSIPWGVIPGMNTVFWEVRNY